MKSILVSIIIPIYKSEAYLARCLDSIINQSYKQLEIILIDDGSPDNSGKICDEYVKLDYRVKVIHQHNQGVSASRNNGIHEATGKYIQFVDSDDWLDKKMIELMIKNAENNDADIVICGFNRYENSKTIKILTYDENKISDKNELLNDLLYITCTPIYHMPWNKLFKRSLITENNIFYDTKISFFEDLTFNFDVFKVVEKVLYIPFSLYNYWLYAPESLTKRSYNDLWETQLRMFYNYKSLYIDTDYYIMDMRKINAFAIQCFKYEISRKTMQYSTKYKDNISYLKKIAACKEISGAIIEVDTFDMFSRFVVWCLRNKAYNILLITYMGKKLLYKRFRDIFEKIKLLNKNKIHIKDVIN